MSQFVIGVLATLGVIGFVVFLMTRIVSNDDRRQAALSDEQAARENASIRRHDDLEWAIRVMERQVLRATHAARKREALESAMEVARPVVVQEIHNHNYGVPVGVQAATEEAVSLSVPETVEIPVTAGHGATADLDPSYGDPVDVSDYSEDIKACLDRFGVVASVKSREVGPTVTRYLLSPGRSTRVADMAKLMPEVSLYVGGQARFIPNAGSGLVGVEVPNEGRADVNLADVFKVGPGERGYDGALTVAAGTDHAGKRFSFDLAKMPHLLVAGTTGSGKSTFVNTMLVNFLYDSPEDVKLILIDPKQVEFAPYEDAAHLAMPVVTDMGEAAKVLDDLVQQMESRYLSMREHGVRTFEDWSAAVGGESRIVAVVDELADLIAQDKSIDKVLARLAAKGRAAGIHLVLATQRPSADVVTGVLKANIPSRVAFAVQSHVDAGVIGVKGAEMLTGRGDGLFQMVGEREPVRFQAAFVSDAEIARVVRSTVD